MKKVLITGGTGFVGKALVPALRTEYEVEVANSHNMKSKFLIVEENMTTLFTWLLKQQLVVIVKIMVVNNF